MTNYSQSLMPYAQTGVHHSVHYVLKGGPKLFLLDQNHVEQPNNHELSAESLHKMR